MESNHTSTSAVLLALLGGAVLGAGIALLYAPQSGRRTRSKIKELGEDAEEMAQEMLAKAEQEVERLKHKAQEWGTRGKDFIEEKKRELANEGSR